jgi:hypothetical protein
VIRELKEHEQRLLELGVVEVHDWMRPYHVTQTGVRHTSLRHCRGKKGVYLIKEAEEIVYIGMSNFCANKALYRHFQRWNDNRECATRRVYDEDRCTVSMLLTDQATVCERFVIRALNPRDNLEKYEEYAVEYTPAPVEETECPF